MRNRGGCEYFRVDGVNFALIGSSTELVGLMCFNGVISPLCLRFEVDLSTLSFNERHLYTHVLNPGKGRLVFLATLRQCWGVSISDMDIAPLEKPDEKDTIVERFVSLVFGLVYLLFKKIK